MKIFRSVLSSLALIASVCAVATAGQLPPFYPAPKNIQYTPRTIPVDQVSATLTNGISVRINDVQSEQSLSGTWKCSGLTNSTQPFNESEDLDKGYTRADFDDSKWDDIAVPLNWYKRYKEAQKTETPYVKGWYRKTITIPSEKQGGSVVLHFGVIGYQADLYFNGKLAGSHHGDFTPWDLDVTQLVKFGSPNTIAIRVFSDFGPSNGVKAPAKHAYGSQWGVGNIKGGIWQDASIKYAPSVFVKRVLISPNVANSSIKIQYWIENNSGKEQAFNLSGVVRSAMKSDDSKTVANADLGKVTLAPGENNGTATIKLDNPRFWSPDDPYLYYMVLALTDGKEVVSASANRFGFRDFKVRGKYFYMNGKRIYLFGENMGSVRYGGDGKDPEKETAEVRDLLFAFKSKGYNIIRTAHMPAIKQVYDLADEIGIMLYDEWAWAFTTSLDEKEFEKNDLAEVQEWIYRDYNHPSVVMWSCGNEVSYKENPTVYRQLNKQVQLARSLEKSGRPVSSFSGAAFDFGTEKLDTDLLDLHRYLGTGSAAWTRFEDDMNGIYKFVTATYGQDSSLNIPFIVWECIGLSWGDTFDASYAPGNVDKYAEYAAKPTTWEEPNGIGFAGLFGLAAALDANRGSKYGQAIYGKHMLEVIRYHDEMAGFAPWYLEPTQKAATLWTQPTYCGLRTGTGIPQRHFFSNRTYNPSLFVVNSSNNDLSGAVMNIALVGSDGTQQTIAKVDYPDLKAWAKKEQPANLKIPASIKPGQYQMRLILTSNGQEVSRNFYDVFVQNPAITTSAINTQKSIAILKPETDTGVSFAKILAGLKVKATPVSSLTSLSKYQVLIVPPSTAQHSLLQSEQNRSAIIDWVSKGGILLSMEQNYEDKPWLGGKVTGAETTFVDLVVPKHPIFNGFVQDDFDTWDNPYYGFCITHALDPFTKNVLAARSPFHGSQGVLNAVAEGGYGKGRIIASQLCATPLWNTDSVATTYLHNLLSYTLGKNLVTPVRPWQVGKSEAK